jgi:hypothetical protein
MAVGDVHDLACGLLAWVLTLFGARGYITRCS